MPGSYLLSLQIEGTDADFISYPYFPVLLDGNNDTIATGTIEFFGQFGGSVQGYTVTSTANIDEMQFTAIFVYSVNGNDDTCTLNSPLTLAVPATQVADESLLVSPNPSTDQINVNSNEQTIGSNFTLSNSCGQVVLRGKINSTNTAIDLVNLSKGIYFLSVGENRKPIKVVKE